MKKIFLLVLYCVLFVPCSLPQNNGENGYPLITNYSPKEYEAQQQNWAIIQDDRGIMYFGNGLGLLEFDGADWRLYQLSNKSVVRSLANGENRKIYAGGVGDLGYFQPDSIGKLTFHSLMKYVPKDKRDFSDVWQTFVVNGKVFFNASKYILTFNVQKKEFKVIQSEKGFHLMFKVNGLLYVREWGKGIEIFNKDSLVLLKGSQKFAEERIYVMLPFPGEENTILIGSRSSGLFKYDGNNFIPFKTDADEFIKENLIYYPGVILSDQNILLGTISGGSLVIDTTGKEIIRYNNKSGIISNTNVYTFQDLSGAIWLATDNGISRIDYASKISYFDNRNNFTSSPNNIIRFNEIIYVATNNGVYYLNPQTSDFNLLKNNNNQSFIFLKSRNDLLMGGFNGLFKVEKEQVIPVRKTLGNEYNVQSLRQSKINPDRIYVGATGLWSILRSNKEWIDEGQILDITDVVNSIIEDSNGKLWIGTNASGVYRITLWKDNKGKIILDKTVIEHFDKTNGLPNVGIFIDKLKGINYFSSIDSIYKFDENRKKFFIDNSDKIIAGFNNLSNHKNLTLMQQDSLGRIWLGAGKMLAMGMPQPDGSYKWLTAPFKRFSDEQVSNIYAEKDGVVWFLAAASLVKYDFANKNLNKTGYFAMVRNVVIGSDSTIYFGGQLSNQEVNEISYKNNSIKFRYSATSYEGKNTNQFKTYLKGFDENWSGWTKENIKEYTNLSPGNYQFNVIAKNLDDLESKEASFSFVVVSPWYRTLWAYIGYIVIFGGLVFSVDRVQRRRLMFKEKQRSRLRESELRAEAAEAETKALQAENDRNKNIELLSEIGKEITATLDLDKIFLKLYEHVNQLADATIFGLGIYNHEKEEIEYKLSLERGKKYPPYSRNIKDKDQFPVWCIDNRKPVFINDVSVEYKKYIRNYKKPHRQLEDGTMSEEPWSIIYLPLISQDRLLGIITIQSFHKNAYQDYHLNLLQNLASYTAIALDNADAYKKLHETVDKLNTTLNDLKSTQEKLVVQEKLASLGQLTAGIAHEIKNPLNFVNNFAQLSIELVTELREEFEKIKDKIGKDQAENVEDILSNIEQNASKINEHGNRADSIVRSMLQHSRGKSGERILSDINAILEEDLNLAYHGLRARDNTFNASIEKDFDKSLEKISIVPQDVSRVFLNIINNGFYEASKKKKSSGDHFSPCVKVTTRDLEDKLEVRIKDNGNGIPEEVREKIFDPFFTTKPSGEGTGLGLSLSYDIIVKEHAGEIKFNSKLGEYTEFIITLPKK